MTSSFSVHNGVRVIRDDEKGREALAQYITYPQYISLEKITDHDETGTIIYHSKMTSGKKKRNFQIYTAAEFIAAITQNIPNKSFQTRTELVEVCFVMNAYTQRLLKDFN